MLCMLANNMSTQYNTIMVPYFSGDITELLPVLSTPPESYEGTYTAKSDTYMAAMTSLEIMQLGHHPYDYILGDSQTKIVEVGAIVGVIIVN